MGAVCLEPISDPRVKAGRVVIAGVQPTFVVDACVKRPDLFQLLTRNGEKAWDALHLLVENCDITYEDAIRVFARWAF